MSDYSCRNCIYRAKCHILLGIFLSLIYFYIIYIYSISPSSLVNFVVVFLPFALHLHTHLCLPAILPLSEL